MPRRASRRGPAGRTGLWIAGCAANDSDADAVVSQPLSIVIDQSTVTGEDVVAQGSDFEEVLEMRGVLLVPEDSGDTQFTTCRQQLARIVFETVLAGELVLPLARVAVPRRFDEDEVQSLELIAPALA